MESTLIIAGGILLGCLISLSWFAGSDAPFIPTKKQRIKKILKLAKVGKGQEFWELGSGDGRIVLEAAKMRAKAFGVEQSLLRILWSRWKARSLKNAHFIHGDIFKQNFSSADTTFIFLLPKGVGKLEPLLRKTLKKGSRVITQTFHFKNWRPYKKVFLKERNTPNALLGKNSYEGDFWIYKN